MIRALAAIAAGSATGIILSAAIAYAFVSGWPIPLLDQDFGPDF